MMGELLFYFGVEATKSSKKAAKALPEILDWHLPLLGFAP